MKHYVFLTNSIRNMGGAQMYLRNKMLFLEERGWHVSVFFFNEGEILIPELQRFSSFLIPDLRLQVSTVSKKRSKDVIARMIDMMGGANGECFIETHVYQLSYWAELLAKETGGYNLLCFLHEQYPSFSEREIAYLHYKCKRGELLKSSSWIESRLGQHWMNDKTFKLPSYSNVTTKKEFKFEYDSSLKSILSIGRLDKPYIMPMLSEIVAFARNEGADVNLFLVGGAAEESYLDDIKSFLADKHQIIPYFFGYMYPVPENIIKSSDVAIATSGAVMVPTEMGVPTIAVDAQDYMAIGVYGVTTQNKMRRTIEPPTKIAVLLHDILVNKKYIGMENAGAIAEKERNQLLQNHLSIVEEHDAVKEYYDVFSIYSRKEILKQKAVMMLYEVLGEYGVARVAKMWDSILGRK